MVKTKKTLPFTAMAVATLALAANPSFAEILFSDDFESPDVEPGYEVKNTSRQVDETKWVRSSVKYGADESGIVDEGENGGGNFTDPVGSQAYGTRYTNSGVTTAEGVIGALTAGVTYTVTFDVVVDGSNKGDVYKVGLVTIPPAAARNDSTFLITVNKQLVSNGASAILALVNGTASGATYERKSFSYTADGTEGTLGQDLAVRIEGFTHSANIDNVVVSSTGGVSSPSDGVTSKDFSGWISAYPGVGDLTGFDDDADGDGIVNGLEYFFGTTPDQVSTGLLANEPTKGVDNEFTFTHPENPTPADNISAPVYNWTTDLETFHVSGARVGGTTITFKRAINTPSTGITTVTATITGAVPDGLFVNLTVTQNP